MVMTTVSASIFLTCVDQSATIQSKLDYEKTTNLHMRKSGKELEQVAHTVMTCRMINLQTKAKIVL